MKAARVEVEFDVPARMRDGVTLTANVYRPASGGPWPTLLTRTPYNKDDPASSAPLDPVEAARRGFMVVVQDARGRYSSEGIWSPFEFEGQDGYDSVEWAARLPGSDGRVAMFGGSYCGNTQWNAAFAGPPSLVAITPLLTWSDPLDGVFARGGAVELGFALPWSLAQGLDHLQRLGLTDDEVKGRTASLVDDLDRLSIDGYWQLPVSDAALLRKHEAPDFGAFRVFSEPDVADRCRVDGHRRDAVDAPSLHVGGWYDSFLQGTLDNYAAVASQGRPAQLVVGPWCHGEQSFANQIGDSFFGVGAAGVGGPAHADATVNDLLLRWFGERIEIPEAGRVTQPEKPVRIFVMGRNEWREESAWPLERAVAQQWFLRAGGGLGLAPPTPGETPDEFVYDPADPVPTRGGNLVMGPFGPPGPFDQRSIEDRDDVLVFTSAPLPEALEVTGRVRLVLYAESSAVSTDWVGRLCDVHPDGTSLNVCDGILRISGSDRRPRRCELDLWSTSFVFLAGHRLRVQVTSSCFPRWDRNLGTGDQGSTEMVIARQLVHHDEARPSLLELPVVLP